MLFPCFEIGVSDYSLFSVFVYTSLNYLPKAMEEYAYILCIYINLYVWLFISLFDNSCGVLFVGY